MGKETVLPKNIRQIGDIRGREKICMEDYVMTYIRKKEPEEEQGYLGIFLGEKKQTEDSDYILIRGILEIPREDVKQMENAKENAEGIKTVRENGRKTDGKNDSGEIEKKPDETDAAKETDKKTGKIDTTKEAEKKKEEEPSARPETLAEKIQKERRLYFPEWEIQGCCVIGTYPAARMEELAKAVPESCSLLYHLQEQEENFYWMKNGQYQRIRGYFVFYEQNKLMQEYMSEVFGSNSVEKESQPDRAIRNFREKIAQKSEKKSRSMLKLASSFFVVTVLVVGAVVVNRMDDIRSIQSLPSEISEYQAAEVVSNLNTALDTSTSTAADGSVAASNTTSDIVLNTADSTPEQEALYLTDELAGSAAFWDEAYEDTAASADAADSANTDSITDASAESALTAADNSSAADLPAAQEASSMRQTYAAYVIKEGDTLADICNRYYGDLNHLEEICEVNEIEDANRIMPGQKIVLP